MLTLTRLRHSFYDRDYLIKLYGVSFPSLAVVFNLPKAVTLITVPHVVETPNNKIIFIATP